jgi:hypothetical protein
MKQTSAQLKSKKKWRRTHPKQAAALSRRSQRVYYEKLKKKIYDHYGRMCACCGETEPFFLTIGHVNGDGAAHRAALGFTRGGGSMAVYRDIVRRAYPDSFRVECDNCNVGAHLNGGVCPHKTAKIASDEHPTPTHES